MAILKTRDITKRQKKDLLAKIRIIAAAELNQLIKVRQEYTGKEVAQTLGLDPARISEILASTPKTFAEQTLRKLIGGGVLKVADILKKVNPTPEEMEYLRKFRAFEDKELGAAIENLSKSGLDVASLLVKLNFLAKKGVNVADTLDNLLKKVG